MDRSPGGELPMFGNVTAPDGLHVTEKYRNRSMQYTCPRNAAWDPHRTGVGRIPVSTPTWMNLLEGFITFCLSLASISANRKPEMGVGRNPGAGALLLLGAADHPQRPPRPPQTPPGAGFRVQGAGCRVQGSGCRVQGSGCRVQGSGFRVQGAGFRVQGVPRVGHHESGSARP